MGGLVCGRYGGSRGGVHAHGVVWGGTRERKKWWTVAEDRMERVYIEYGSCTSSVVPRVGRQEGQGGRRDVVKRI